MESLLLPSETLFPVQNITNLNESEPILPRKKENKAISNTNKP